MRSVREGGIIKLGNGGDTSYPLNMGEVCKWEFPGGGAIRFETDTGAYVVFDIGEIERIKDAITNAEGRT